MLNFTKWKNVNSKQKYHFTNNWKKLLNKGKNEILTIIYEFNRIMSFSKIQNRIIEVFEIGGIKYDRNYYKNNISSI